MGRPESLQEAITAVNPLADGASEASGAVTRLTGR